MDPVPTGSIYFWCYTQGLKHVDLYEIECAVRASGKEMRQKDYDNYWNGYRNSNRSDDGSYRRRSILEIEPTMHRSPNTFYVMEYSEYPDLPDGVEPADRWIPCTKNGKPLTKWGEKRMTKGFAEFWNGSESLAENLKGCRHIVVDIDGDHDKDNPDAQTIAFGNRLRDLTETYMKPWYLEHETMCPSMHLVFKTDKVIPTRHFPNAHIDILGNKTNQARYFKDKVSNNLPQMEMTDYIWSMIVEYIKEREGVSI